LYQKQNQAGLNIVYDIVYDIVCDILYISGFSILRMHIVCPYRIRYWRTISYMISYVRRTISYFDVRHRIRCRQNVRHRRFLPHCCHFDVRHRIRHRRFLPHCCQFDVRHRIRHRTSTYDVVYDIRVLCRDYTISYVYIGIIRYRTSISSKTNDMPYDVACDIVTYDIDVYDVRYCLLVFPGAVGTGHWHLGQSGSHPAVTGSARTVLYVISALTVPVSEIQVVCLPGPLHGASDGYGCASSRGSSVSALNPSYDCPHFGSINLHARARANVCAREIKRDSTPLQGI
jgi:hypothetical protein